MANQPFNFQYLIEKTQKHGYFDQLKTISNMVNSSPNKFQSMHRKKVASFYAKKLMKPFRLIDQPEYLNQKNFNKNFSAYMSSLPQFESISKTEIARIPLNKVEKVDRKVEREAYENTLVNNMLSEISPEKRAIRKNQYTHASKTSYYLSESPYSFFSKSKLDNHKEKEIKSFQTSPLNINSSRKSNPYKSVSKKNPPNTKRLNSRSPRSNASKSIIATTSLLNSGRKIMIDEEITLKTLNRLQETQFKMRNFRMQKVKLYELLCKKYGQDILVNFFALQPTEDLQGIINFVSEIYRVSDKLAQMLTFLTFDYNQDGIISEDDLTQLNNRIGSESRLNQDLITIMTYVKNNPNSNSVTADLPSKFINNPTYKEYLRMNNLIKVRREEKMTGVLRHFCFKQEEGDDDNMLPDIKNKKSKKTSGSHKKNSSKKYFKLNFEHFQAAFDATQNKRPKFIADVIEYLVGKQNQSLFRKDETQLRTPLRMSRRPSRKLSKKLPFSEHKFQTVTSLPSSPQRRKRMTTYLNNLKEHKKYLSTVKFD